ncbi:MAG: DsrE family protein [Chloroflexi bacterium]|nr:DsrE family protein [Chloroflexota bacterium]MCL5108891.1 DsrE family protein [Chloroflexota bacterium]MDA8216696.1 DsrE family protein [Dehalococcoidales bacterium]
MRLAILLASGPESDNARTAKGLAAAAAGRGHDVFLFFNADGVTAAASLSSLQQVGVRMAACAHSARQRGVTPVAGVRWGGQLDWAEAVHDANRVIALD